MTFIIPFVKSFPERPTYLHEKKRISVIFRSQITKETKFYSTAAGSSIRWKCSVEIAPGNFFEPKGSDPSLSAKIKKPTTVGFFILAEREGFEPPDRKPVNGFQDRRIRPLCHLSEEAAHSSA